MRATDLRIGDTVVVRLDGRERRGRVTAFPTVPATGGRRLVRVRVVLVGGASVVIPARSILRREGRGAFARGGGGGKRPVEREIAS